MRPANTRSAQNTRACRIPLEQAQAVVDLAGCPLAKFGRVDLMAAAYCGRE